MNAKAWLAKTGKGCTELLVTGAYREVLLRDTDAVGMDYWEKLIDTGTLNQSLLAQSIACTAKDAA